MAFDQRRQSWQHYLVMTNIKSLITKLPVLLAALILAVMVVILSKDKASFFDQKSDLPPTIDFTWSPAGEVSLLEMKAKLKLSDDRALDFKTYKMTLVEINREIKLPMAESLIGKDYEDNLSFSLFASDPKLIGKEKLTVRIQISDTKGHSASIERIIKIKPAGFNIEWEAR